mmetsp:Transcript_30108/g.48131  ORF Transcript_30108/g.48131 Transcript_30108/m.48131 type:complete len:448 (+) Transcript_30108:93-1436(+)|eukprot:CAMPEP_0197028516 /NCGR_PEP_ID=MMETSP1384-20130603/8192_1 /TAXON_ID=29189 /ORGANISM="Ammonia sp." /LENGTH=447 /DNA_ID=CAMNT_0042457533 /DNA_START=36 /DNA_END=1379 /DNA_ORIENTATION=+
MAEEKAIEVVKKSDVNIDDIVAIKEEDQIGGVVAKYNDWVQREQKKYYEIDITQAMTNLTTCGSLIQLSYVSAEGFPCQKDVTAVLGGYSDLVKDSYLASAKFVIASITGVEYVGLALKALSKKPSLSLKLLAKCAKLAQEMAAVAGDLSEKAKQLGDLAQKALENAVGDKTVSQADREKLVQQMNDTKAEQERLAKLQDDTAKLIQEAKKEEAEAAKAAEKEAKRNFIGNVVKNVLSLGISGATGNDKQGGPAAERLKTVTENKHKYQQQLLDANSNLAKQVSLLGSYTEKKDQLQRAIASITVTIQTLGKIKVIFGNTRLFWKGVEANCNRLLTLQDQVAELASDADMIEIFIDEIRGAIRESGLTWFILCKVNWQAKEAIIAVDKRMDGILNDLPDEAGALELVDTLSKQMAQELADEKKAIEESMAPAIEDNPQPEANSNEED